MLLYCSLALLCFGGFLTASADDLDYCVPKPSGFTFKNRKCPNARGDAKVVVTNIRPMQDGKPVRKVDITKPLDLIFTIKNTYGRPIQQNRFDMRLFHYKDTGDGCQWDQIESGDLLNDIDACTIIEKNCAYNGGQTTYKYKVNFRELLGDLADMTVPDNYYSFEINQRDGSTPLSCITIQNQLK